MSKLTRALVELPGLCNIAGTQSHSLTNLRSGQSVGIPARQYRVDVCAAGERVTGVVHDALKVICLAQRLYLIG